MSGGEQQMLAMGRALMSNASMLMLDEPSMGLSPLLVQEIFDIIQNVHKEGMTILLMEQNAQMALSVADRAYVLETALKLVKDADHNVDVLDMCCGSGCIGVSFGLWNKNSRIVLADVSEAAIGLARRNVAKLCAGDDRFEVVRTDLFEQISGKYDLILSNPPYIRSDVIETLMPEVREHEPHLALDGTADGLYFYRIIADKAREYIKDEGYVVFEIGNDQAEDVQYLLVDSGYDDIHVVQDLSGNDRVVYGRYDREDNR
jgi:release factor glutamine methyltransferase